jgi:hypothetical protein
MRRGCVRETESRRVRASERASEREGGREGGIRRDGRMEGGKESEREIGKREQEIMSLSNTHTN